MHRLAVAENIFFLVLVAIIGLIRWIMAAAEKTKNSRTEETTNPTAPNAPVSRAPGQTEEERVRRFFEALGVPTSNAPPPEMSRRTVIPKTLRQARREVRPIDPFPRPRPTVWNPEDVVVAPPPLATSATPPPIPESPPPLRAEPVALKGIPPVFEVREVGTRAEEPVVSAPSQNWGARLATASSLRDAIVLREIFGPPRSQQNFDLLSLG